MIPVNPKESLEVNGTQKPVVVRQPELAVPVPGDTATPLVRLPEASTHTPHTWAEVFYRAQNWLGTVGRWSWKLCKLFVCVGLDLADMVMVGWIGINPIFEVGAALITMALWGSKKGVWAFAELADFTELLDPWIPTCTIIALASWNND